MRRNRINNTRELLRIVRSVVVAEKIGVPHVRICLVEPERLDFDRDEVCVDIDLPRTGEIDTLSIRTFIGEDKEGVSFIFSQTRGLTDEVIIAKTEIKNNIDCVEEFLAMLSESVNAAVENRQMSSGKDAPFSQQSIQKLMADEAREDRGWSTYSTSRGLMDRFLQETSTLLGINFETSIDERCPQPTVQMINKNGKSTQVYVHVDGSVFVSVEGGDFHQLPNNLSVRELYSIVVDIAEGARLPERYESKAYPYELFWGGEKYPEWLPKRFNWEDVTGIELNPSRRGLEKVIFNKKLCVNRMVDIRKVDNRYGDIIADFAARNTVNYVFPGMKLRISEGMTHSKIGAVTEIHIYLYENSATLRSKTEILPDVFVPQSTLNVGRTVHEIIKLFNKAAESEYRFERMVDRMRKDLLHDIPKVAPRTMFRQEPHVND